LFHIYNIDIDAFDANKDGQKELVLFSIDPNGWQVDFYETSNSGQSYTIQNTKYITNNIHLDCVVRAWAGAAYSCLNLHDTCFAMGSDGTGFRHHLLGCFYFCEFTSAASIVAYITLNFY
jgi:hypothetical protein